MELMTHRFRTELLQRQTGAEKRFHKLLKEILKTEFTDRKRMGFQCQVPIGHPRGFYLLDFYINDLRLAFEIDGKYHLGRIDKDLERDKFLITQKHIIIHHIPNFNVIDRKRRRLLRLQVVEWIKAGIVQRKRNETKWQALKHGWRKASDRIVIDSGKCPALTNEESIIFFNLEKDLDEGDG